jgi:hypothetical protein
MESVGAGVHISSTSLWDAESDGMGILTGVSKLCPCIIGSLCSLFVPFHLFHRLCCLPLREQDNGCFCVCVWTCCVEIDSRVFHVLVPPRECCQPQYMNMIFHMLLASARSTSMKTAQPMTSRLFVLEPSRDFHLWKGQIDIKKR